MTIKQAHANTTEIINRITRTTTFEQASVIRDHAHLMIDGYFYDDYITADEWHNYYRTIEEEYKIKCRQLESEV